MQGVWRGEHLRARSEKEQVQNVQSGQGRVHAAGSRGAVTSKFIGVRQNIHSFPFAFGDLSCLYFLSCHCSVNGYWSQCSSARNWGDASGGSFKDPVQGTASASALDKPLPSAYPDCDTSPWLADARADVAVHCHLALGNQERYRTYLAATTRGSCPRRRPPVPPPMADALSHMVQHHI